MERRNKREVILSCIIGDGYIWKQKNKECYRLHMKHGSSQIDYLQWKLDLLKEVGFAKIDESIKQYQLKTHVENGVYITSSKTLKIYKKWFYNNEEKTVKNILKYLKSPLSLAIWFMDDGSVFKRKRKHKDGSIYYLKPSMKLCTHSFSREDNELILKWLKDTFNIEGYMVVERKRNRPNQPEYYTLNFNADNTLRIWDLIKPYVNQVESMKSKFTFISEYYN